MKKMGIVLGLAAGMGVLLMAVGFVAGGIHNLTIDGEGIHIIKEGQPIQTDLEEVTGLEIDVSSARIEIITAEKGSLEIDCSNNSLVTWSQEKGILRIQQDYKFYFGFNLVFRNDVIRIYLPETAVLDTGRIEISSGSVNLTGMNCKTLDLRASSGDLDIANVIAEELSLHCTSGRGVIDDCSVKQMHLSLTSGDLKATRVKSEGMSARLTSGSINLSGEFFGDNSIDITSGTCVMELIGAETDYSQSVSVVSGSVTVNGQKTLGNNTNPLKPHILRIKVTSGTAQIRFLD